VPRTPTIVLTPVLEPEVVAIGRDQLPPGFALEVVPARELATALPEADYLLGFVGSLSDELLLGASRLKLVQLMSVGYDTFNLAGARRVHLPVAVNGGANAIGVAEHTIMLMLAALKRLTELNAEVHSGVWRGGMSGARLYELWGSTVGIVGLGRIGQAVARRLGGWDAELIYFDPVPAPPERAEALGVRRVSLEELLARADVVTLHIPLSDATRHIVDAGALGLMKRTATLVNTARGGLIDEAALVDALDRRALGGAALNVLSAEPPPPDHPLLGRANVIVTPHTAGPTWQSWPRRFENSFANIARVERGERPEWVVPELQDLVS